MTYKLIPAQILKSTFESADTNKFKHPDDRKITAIKLYLELYDQLITDWTKND
jgi:hypothetical protein